MAIATQADTLHITSVHPEQDWLVVDMSDGRRLSTPISWYPRLARASQQQRENWRLIGGGEGIHWPELDEDLSLAGMLLGRKPPPASHP